MCRGSRGLMPAISMLLTVLAGFSMGPSALAASPPPPVPDLPYADLADLADRAPMVARVQIRKVAAVEPARAPGVRAGWARIYVEARTLALLSGPPLAGDSLRYLADVPLDAKGRLPKLAKREALVFGRTVSGKPGEVQLVAPDAQILWSPGREALVRTILADLLASGAPGRVSRVTEAIYVPGNLAGTGETQMFLATADGEPASITVIHAPGQQPRWTVSFSEVVDSSGEAPRQQTLPWYRLACFLPRSLQPSANVSASPADKAQAAADYAFVLDQLGPCERTRG